jgi:hypothetical protein
MITKKLAVPLINEKILLQAEHCYIATSAITAGGFDLIRSRISPKCKMDIVTSLDGLTSPQVLKQIYSRYQGRITLNIYTRNVLHANVYVFYLPFRKAVAFVGSGNFSLEGLKDHEELFWKITDPKEIESIMSWFTGYFEFGNPLDDQIIAGYEHLYPIMKRRAIKSAHDKQLLISSAGINWDAVKFRLQYFDKEDYQTFSITNAASDNAALRLARMRIQSKLISLQEALSGKMDAMKLDLMRTTAADISSVEPDDHDDRTIRSMSVSYVQNREDSQMQIVTPGWSVSYLGVTVWLDLIDRKTKQNERDVLRGKLQNENYRTSIYKTLSSLGSGYTLEVAGVKRSIETLTNEQALAEFFSTDDEVYFDVQIEKRFAPGDHAISSQNIEQTLLNELAKLVAFQKI